MERYMSLKNTVFVVTLALIADISIRTVMAPTNGLGRDALVASRGRDINNVLQQQSCDLTNKNFVCGANDEGNACATCQTQTYTDTFAGNNGGYDRGVNTVLNGCGFNYVGSCKMSVCNTQQFAVGNCADPPSSPTVQPVTQFDPQTKN